MKILAEDKKVEQHVCCGHHLFYEEDGLYHDDDLAITGEDASLTSESKRFQHLTPQMRIARRPLHDLINYALRSDEVFAYFSYSIPLKRVTHQHKLVFKRPSDEKIN